jgi:hypothetical protein
LRKARNIHKKLGITVPLPTNSEGVMETLLQSLFRSDQDPTQQALFADEALAEVEVAWDRAAAKETMSRTRFAQRAIKPAEIAEDLEKTDAVLGDPETVERFVVGACRRVGAGFTLRKGQYEPAWDSLHESIRVRLTGNTPSRVAFHFPCPGATYMGRNHPLTIALAGQILDQALSPVGDRGLAARCGVIRSKDVERLTVLLLLRLRFAAGYAQSEPALAEDVAVTGFAGLMGSETWLADEEAMRLFEDAKPTANLSDAEKRQWLREIPWDDPRLTAGLDRFMGERAAALIESHERMRRAIKGRRFTVKPLPPPDVLAVSVIIPAP